MGRKAGLEIAKMDLQDVLASLQGMNKEELMSQCYQLASSLHEAQENITMRDKLLKEALVELEEVKRKTPGIAPREYNPHWSWVNKIVFVLKKMDRPLCSSELIKVITPYEPVLQHSRFKAQAFSAHLHKAVKYHRVATYKLGGSRGYYYVLPEWMDAAGGIRKEYENKILLN